MITYPGVCRVCGGIGWIVSRETHLSVDCPACGGTGNEPERQYSGEKEADTGTQAPERQPEER